jgi:hypothetical protein
MQSELAKGGIIANQVTGMGSTIKTPRLKSFVMIVSVFVGVTGSPREDIPCILQRKTGGEG